MDSEKILSTYVNAYENKIHRLYKHIEEHHEEAFPLLKFKDYLNVALFKVDRDTFGMHDYIVIVDNMSEIEKEHDFNTIDGEDLKILMDKDKRNRFQVLIEHKYPEISEKPIFKILNWPTGLYNRDGSLNISSIEENAKQHVEIDHRTWVQENKTPVSSYNHDNVSSHSHLDYSTLIKKFNSKEFRDDFVYQMNQAEECYKRHLYLPAAATLSVALETVLADLCKSNRIKIKNKTEMNHLTERLVEEGIINYRLGKRIDLTYSLRNSVAHTNNGEVSKDDCSIILNCIRTIIEEHY